MVQNERKTLFRAAISRIRSGNRRRHWKERSTYFDSYALISGRYKPVRTEQPLLEIPEHVVMRGRRHTAVRRRRQSVMRGRAARVRRRGAFVLLYAKITR